MNRLQSFRMKVKEVLTILPVALLLGLGVVGTLAPEQAYAASSSVPDYNPVEGKRFWVTFLSNNNGATEEEAKKVIQLVAVSRNGATVTVHYSEGGTPQDPTTVIAAGEQQTITIDKSRAYNLSAGTNMHSVLVTSTDTISLYAAVRDGSYYESSFILPEGALGYEYVVQNNRRNQSDLRSEYAVVAVESGTTKVHIKQRESNETSTPTTPDVKSETTVSLTQGQVYFVKSTSQYMELDEYGDPVLDYDDNPVYYFGNLSGTSIDADKKIAVFQADEGTMTPYLSGLTQNYIFEQALPISSWGKEFVVVRSERAQYEVVRITTVYKDTKISLKSAVDGTIHTETISNPFSTLEYPFIATNSDLVNKGDLYITADYPIMVSTYIPCKYINNNWGAPAVAAVPPMRQGMKDVTIGLTNYAMSRYFANVIVPTNAVSSMKLDGSSIASSFTAFEGTPYSYARLNLGTSSTPKHLSNSEAPFVAYAYGHGKENAFYYATGFNNVPAAPELYVDNYRVSHGDEAQFCNQHPGVTFKAVVDYPHDSIKWDLGEGAISVVKAKNGSYNNRHMYGKTISQGDTTHNIRLYVFHHSPLAGIKDTDSICVSLVVHPVYYDTLKTKVAAKHLEYIWNKSSNPAFGIDGKGEIAIGPVTMGKDATNPNNKWTKADKPEVTSIFDSLVYKTQTYGCDSIFYLQLEVVPDTIMKKETASVCQGEAFTWAGHHNAWNHLTQNGTPITEINTATAGTFEIRDTMQSLVFPYPDSIHVLTLTVLDKPTLTGFPTTKIERCAEDESPFTISYGSQYATQIEYWMRSGTDPDIRHVTEAVGSSFSITTPEDIEPGDYVLYAKTLSATCQSVTYQVDVKIHKRPTLKSLSMKEGNTAKCYPADEFVVEYDHTNNPTEIWYKVTEGENLIKDWTKEDVVSGKTFTINTATPSNWADGKTYTVEAYVKTNAENGSCESEHKTTTFQILKQPTITNVSITNQCDDETKTVLKFTTADATKYRYKFDSGGWSDYLTGIADGDHIVSNLYIGSLSHGTHTITMQAASEACLSEETTPFEFTIYEMPTASITTTSDALNKCIKDVTGNETISYTYSAVTTQIKWQLDRPGTRSTIGWNTLEVGKPLTITPAQLDTAGHYVLTITAHSAHCDSTELKKGTLEFDLYDTAHIDLKDIKNVCKGVAVNATYTTTDHPTTKYTYQIDTEGGETKIGPTVVETIDGKIPSTGTKDLAAGMYVLRVWASNGHNCAASEVRKTFEIYPIPVISSLTGVANLCQEEGGNLEITVDGTNVQKVNYELKRNDASWVTEEKVALTGGKFTLRTDSLSAGDYKLTAMPISDHGCEGAWFTPEVTFTVYPKPEVKLTKKDYTFCEGSKTTLDVAYTQKNVSRIDWFLKLKSGGDVIKNGNITSFSGTFTIDGVNTLEAGNYIVYASAINDHSGVICHSKNDTINVKVNKTPTETSIESINNACFVTTGTTTVKYNHKDAEQFRYKLDDAEWTDNWADVTASKEFELNIGGLTVGTHKLYLQTKRGTCLGEPTGATEFTIYANPTLTLTPASGIWPVDNIDVSYTGTGLTGGTYSYKLTGGDIPSGTPRTGSGSSANEGTISVNTSGLKPEKYNLEVTATSADGCEVKATTKIDIFYPTDVEIDVPIVPVDSCEGTTEPIKVYIHTKYADKYSYEVVLKGTTEHPVDNYSGSETYTNTEDTPVDKTIELDIRNWAAGTYTVTVTAENTTIGAKKSETVDFIIYPKPVLTFTQPEAVCAGATTTVTIQHSTENVNTVAFRVEKDGADFPSATWTTSTGSITLNTSDWTGGEYKIYGTPTSKYGCEGEESAVPAVLVVNDQPTASITAIDENVCEGTAYLNVGFDASADAHAYAFSILNAGDQSVKTGGDDFSGGSLTVAVDIKGLEPGSYKFELKTQTEKGCWSKPDTKSFSVRDTFLNVTKAKICESETYTWKYGDHSEEIKGSDHFHNPVKADTIDRNFPTATYGCDSIYRLILTVEKEYVFVTDTTICYGEKFNWIVKDKCSGEPVELMRGLTATTYQVDTLPCGDLWCPPVYILDLKVREEYAAEAEYYTLSEDETLTWRGQSITEAGTYEDRKSQETGPASGCDSVWRIIVDKAKVERKVSNQDVCYGETVYFNHKKFTNLPVGQSVLFDTLRTTTGYDSVYLRLNLTVGQRYYDSVSVSACDHYVWPVNGNTYMHSGIYREELATVDGCDSIFVLNLTVNKGYEFYETYDIDSTQLPFTIHDYTYTGGGEFDRAFTAKGGCDSIYHLQIIVHEELYESDTVTRVACTNELPYLWRGGKYYHTGIYSVTTKDPDSTHVMYLTVNDAYSDTTYVHACSSYTWPVNGVTYDASTIVPVDKKTTLDCDSTVVLKLTMGAPTTATVGVNACQYEMTTVGNRTFVPTGLTYPDFTRTLRNSSGCDSTVTYKVTVIPRFYKTDTTFADICEGATYTWDNSANGGGIHTYTKAGTYYDSVPDANGCTKDVYTLKLSAKPTYWIDEDVEVHESALPYAWVGHKGDTLLSTNGDYYDYLTSVISGCDSIHHIHFHVNWVERHYDAPLEGCESVKWRNKTYTESGLVSDTVFTDSKHTKYKDVYFCEITVNHKVEQAEPDFTICQNEAFTWHGQSYEASHFEPGDHPLTAESANECDTIYKTTLHVKQTYYVNETMNDVCATDLPIEWHGQLLTKDDISGGKIKATDFRPAPNGCDTIYSLTMTVHSVTAPQVSPAAAICLGKTYEWKKDGKLLMTIPGKVAGTHTYYYWYTVPGECDSTYLRLDLTVNDPETPTPVNVFICHGEKYDWVVPGCNPGDPEVVLMKGLTESTQQTYTLPCEGDGCSPIYELNLTVYPEYAHVDDPAHLCAGETLKWRGLTITKGGEYEARVEDAVDVRGDGSFYCDSIYRITVTKLEPEEKSSSMTVCYGTPVVFNNHEYTGLEVGNHTLKETISSVVDGCDSLYLTLNLTVEPYSYDSIVVTECDSYTWKKKDGGDGKTYTESGIYRVEEKTSSGCGTVSVLNLTINKSYSFNEAYDKQSTEMPFTVHGYKFEAAGSHDCAFTTGSGCDSIYHVTLTVHEVPLPVETTNDAMCEGEVYMWGDQECTESGTYSYTVLDGTKEVAIKVLNLTVYEKYSNTTNVKHCGTSYKWDVDGKTYSKSGTYTWEGKSLVTGCDSTEILVLKLGQPNTGEETVTVCQNEPVTIGNRSFVATENTSFTQTLTNGSGCDSVVTYTVNVTPRTYTAVEKPDDYCEGTTYTWRGHTYETAGTYFDTTFNGGCATEIHTLELESQPYYRYDKDAHFDEDVEVWEKALPYTWVGHMNDTLLRTNGDYYDRQKTINGCDSIYHIHFHVNFVKRDTVEDSGCDSYTWDVNGKTYTESELVSDTVFIDAEHTDYSEIHFCDVTIYPSYDVDSTLIKHICSDQQPFEWFGQTCSVPQDAAHQVNDHMFVETFQYTKQTTAGCDSLEANLTLYLHLPYETTITEDMSVCDSYNWDGQIITKSGKYERRYDNYGLGGCADSVLYRNFTVYSSETEEEIVEACEYYVWRGEKYTESGDYEDDEAQGGICTKKHILHLTIKEPAKVDIDVKACDTYTWPEADGGTGETYTTSGTYTRTFAGQAANGCDSIRYLNLTIGTTQTVTLPGVTACDSYEWKFTEGGDGQTYTTSTVAEKRTPSLVTGCDSITRLPITINHSVVTDVPAITACYEYHDVQNDIHITTEGYQAITRQYKTAAGCDSTVNFYITVNMPTLIEHTVTACQSYEWKGEVYGPGYYDIVTKYTPDEGYGCDSVVTMHLTVNPTMTTNSTVIVKGTSYYWAEADETLTTAGIHEHTFASEVTGCDSIVRLNLILNDPDSREDTQIICRPDAPYVWQPFAEAPYVKDAQVFSESGDYTEQMHIDDGIREPFDSLRTLHLTIQEQPHTSKTDTACGSYAWDKDGQVHTASGMYLHDGNDGICDYTDTLYLTIHPIPEATEVNVTACDLFTVNGETFRQTGRYERHWSTAFGCDSTVFYNIKINERQTTTVNVDACDSYTWEYAEGESETFTKSGSYTQVLTGANGCDSVVTLVLSIHRPYNVGFDACGHYVDNYGKAEYVWDNRTYNAAGNYEWSYQSVHGCDSIVTMHLSMPVTGTSENVIACDEYLWHGRLLNTTGFYTDTITSLLTGCDSVASLILTMDDHKTGSETVVEPTSSYSWWGETYYESGDYEHRFTMDDGSCDSIATLHLTIEEPLPISNEISATACDAYTWDRETFYTSGVYVRNFPTIDGRDSIVKLTLTINHDTTVYVTDKLCGPYIWHLPNGDRTIDESGEYTEVLQRASGCDSVVTLTLTLCESFNTTFAVEARDVYVWDGRTYTESGDYSRLYSSTQGCDSTVTMQLTIIKTQNAEDEAEACTRYAWADSIFTESTIHSHVFPASTGGDSIVTMTIIIHQPVFTDLYDTVKVCDPADPTYSGTYTLPWNEQVSHTGIYCDTLESALSGCDSIVRFHLQWCDEPLCIDTLPIAYESVCGSYTWDKTGLTYSTTGTYDYHERADDGCEHVSLLRLEILPQAYLTIDTTACESLYWEATDETFTESGTYRYVQTGAAANGCDSTTIVRVVIGHEGEGEIDINSCEAYTINGQTYTESGTYVQDWLTTTTGCDSTLTIHLTLSPTKDTTVSGTACDDTVWNNVTYTETGFWPQVLQTAAGCDSLVTLNLIVYGSKDINYIDTTHCDSIVWGPDREGKDTIIYDDGIYTRVFESAIGCDSTVTMDLRLKRHDFVIARDTQACDSFVWNDKVYFETKTYYDTLVSTRTGCDSITQMHITIDPTIRVEIEDTVPPPFYLWPTENDTIWESGDYLDTVPSFITGCDSITTLHLVMTDSIILDPQEPVRIDTFGYCPGDTVDLIYNLLKGHPTKYILIFDTVAPRVPDYTRDFMSVLDTTDLENHGMDSLFTVVVPENCEPGVYCAHLQLFDDFSSSEVYDFCIRVNYKDAIVSMWTDVVAINNYESKFIGYQWYKDDELIPGATKQYYSDGEDLNACYRARVQLADSSWIFTCEACFDLRTDSLELIAYPTPAPVGQPVTIKAMGILLEKLAGSRITITKEQGLTVKEFTLAEGERSVDVELSAGLYIATLITGDADDRGPRTANVKFIVF